MEIFPESNSLTRGERFVNLDECFEMYARQGVYVVWEPEGSVA